MYDPTLMCTLKANQRHSFMKRYNAFFQIHIILRIILANNLHMRVLNKYTHSLELLQLSEKKSLWRRFQLLSHQCDNECHPPKVPKNQLEHTFSFHSLRQFSCLLIFVISNFSTCNIVQVEWRKKNQQNF